MAPIVVTSLAVVSRVGVGPFWKHAVEGRFGITRIQSFADLRTQTYRSRIAEHILNVNPQECIEEALANRVDRHAQTRISGGKEALTDAGVRRENHAPQRVIGGRQHGRGMMMRERTIAQLL